LYFVDEFKFLFYSVGLLFNDNLTLYKIGYLFKKSEKPRPRIDGFEWFLTVGWQALFFGRQNVKMHYNDILVGELFIIVFCGSLTTVEAA
jgi:hypothetical protein